MKIQELEREKIFQQFLKEKEMIDEVLPIIDTNVEIMASKVVRKIQRENEAATLSKLMQKKATKEQVIKRSLNKLPPFSSIIRWRSSRGVKKCGEKLRRRK